MHLPWWHFDAFPGIPLKVDLGMRQSPWVDAWEHPLSTHEMPPWGRVTQSSDLIKLIHRVAHVMPQPGSKMEATRGVHWLFKRSEHAEKLHVAPYKLEHKTCYMQAVSLVFFRTRKPKMHDWGLISQHSCWVY